MLALCAWCGTHEIFADFLVPVLKSTAEGGNTGCSEQRDIVLSQPHVKPTGAAKDYP